jgi:tetratricopeptide (TPR) repeat protein
MLSLILISLAVVAAQQQAQVAIVQKTSGWCSPAIANVVGNVTVNCIGVDPRALKRLNVELNRKNLQLADKTREADNWTKRYNELEARLSAAGDDSDQSRQAEEYLHEGELEKAGVILDQILAKEDKQTARTAANHYNRGLMFELQFLPLDALPHLKKAYQLAVANESPAEEWKYGQEYAAVLFRQNDFTRAEPVMLATLDNARQLASGNPTAYQPDVADTLNNLGLLYSDTQRLKEAGAAYDEALDIRRQLAKTNPAAYQPDVAATLNNLAMLYHHIERMRDAEAAYQEAVESYRQLAKTNPAANQPHVADTLNNLGTLYIDTQRLKDAEAAFQEALDIRRQLAKANPAAYQPYVAMTLDNLAILYDGTQRMKEAEAAYQEALDIRRHLAKTNPAAYQPGVGQTLNHLGILYGSTERLKEAETAFQEALDIQRQLATTNPATYQPDVAETLSNLGLVYSDTQRLKEAESAFQEALDIQRQLARINPAAYQPYVAMTLNNLTVLHVKTGNLPQAGKEGEEAVSINRQRWKTNPTVAADDLAKSLIIASSAQQESSARCQLMREAVGVARNPKLRQYANKQMVTCPPP